MRRSAFVLPARWTFLPLLALFLALPGSASGQELSDFDYENLSFRGISVEGGYIFPTRVEPTYSFGTRFDLGYLGPGLRIVPGITYWSSTLKNSEVARLERRIETLVASQSPDGTSPTMDLGEIDWTDIAISLDGHMVWSVPYDLLTFLGAGVSAHILNGDGPAITGTFVEDLLDTVTAGLNVHAGLEWPWHDHFRLYGMSRYELQQDNRYFELRFGAQIMFGDPVPGEERER